MKDFLPRSLRHKQNYEKGLFFIKLIVTDIDGVLTNGCVTISADGVETKSIAFRDLDAIGIGRRAGYEFAFLTGEDTEIVKFFAHRFGVERLYAGAKDKLSAITDLSGKENIPLCDLVYIGDSDRDAPALAAVGLGIAPQDASPKAKSSADKITRCNGGTGVLFEVVSNFVDGIWQLSDTAACKASDAFEVGSESLDDMLTQHPTLTVCKEDIWQAYLLLKETFEKGGKLLVCGNGGSASDSEHIVGELMKGFMFSRKIPETIHRKILLSAKADGDYIASNLQGGLPAISLVSQTSLISAIGNDVAANMAFAQQVYAYAKPDDAFLGLSTSGNAKNVIYAAETAKALGMKTIALTGASGGVLRDVCDITIKTPTKVTSEVQEYHVPIYHQLCRMLEHVFFAL